MTSAPDLSNPLSNPAPQQAPDPRVAEVYAVLDAVKDPEIPVVSLVDLGVVEAVEVGPEGQVRVEIIPTFSGCPAIGYMRLNVQEELIARGYRDVEVTVNHRKGWSSDRVTARGRQLLKEFGLSPPPERAGALTVEALQEAECPKCGSRNTQLLSPFGPTLCRAVHHCHACHETFEQFKPL